jgi:nondiscriminating aspartyl-tRNA synthetase
MTRILITDLREHVGEEVTIAAWVDVLRNQGKMTFFDFRDRTGKIQGIVFGKPELLEIAKNVSVESTVTVTGKLNTRPENMVNEKIQNGDIELEITEITVLSKAAILPFDLDADLTIETLLDYRPLTLRRDREQAVFRIQHEILRAFRDFLIGEEFIEFQAPKLVGSDAEGGSEVFKVEYFNEHDAYLATSPQLYKQIMVGVYERVFAVGETFRAEKSATSRHLSEVSMLDIEMGFINNYTDVMTLVSRLMRAICEHVVRESKADLEVLGVPPPKVPNAFPTFTLREAQQLIKKETGKDKTHEPDLEPEDERFLSDYAYKNLESDFVFVTQFPTSKRPFYASKNKDNPEYTDSMDLLFRGLEMCSGGQRVHDYEELKTRIREKGLDPKRFDFYLQAFKYGIPPHGGIGMGLERLTAKMCGVANVKEATLFPRDIHRIDTLLSKHSPHESEENN